MKRVKHQHVIATLRELERMAVSGVPLHEAARRIGETAHFVKYWAFRNHVPFQPRQSRGMPAWLLPEATRQAEAVLRATLQRVRA